MHLPNTEVGVLFLKAALIMLGMESIIYASVWAIFRCGVEETGQVRVRRMFSHFFSANCALSSAPVVLK